MAHSLDMPVHRPARSGGYPVAGRKPSACAGGVARCVQAAAAIGRQIACRELAGTAALLCLGLPAFAAPPPNPNPSLAPWFNDLRQPWTNALCCTVADCRTVDSRLNNGHYEALIDGQWREVPDRLILNRSDNPTGRAVACWTPQAGILCFVRPPES